MKYHLLKESNNEIPCAHLYRKIEWHLLSGSSSAIQSAVKCTVIPCDKGSNNLPCTAEFLVGLPQWEQGVVLKQNKLSYFPAFSSGSRDEAQDCTNIVSNSVSQFTFSEKIFDFKTLHYSAVNGFKCVTEYYEEGTYAHNDLPQSCYFVSRTFFTVLKQLKNTVAFMSRLKTI